MWPKYEFAATTHRLKACHVSRRLALLEFCLTPSAIREFEIGSRLGSALDDADCLLKTVDLAFSRFHYDGLYWWL
jgi:hypothetical protein